MKLLQEMLPRSLYTIPAKAPSSEEQPARAFAPAPAEPKKKIQLYSAEFYQACAVGGAIACGSTHMAVTPLDVVKCNMQIDPTKYKSMGSSFGLVVKEQGMAGLVRGWFPTLIGYSIQGSLKFGLYEYFKKYVDRTNLPTIRCCDYAHHVFIRSHCMRAPSGDHRG